MEVESEWKEREDGIKYMMNGKVRETKNGALPHKEKRKKGRCDNEKILNDKMRTLLPPQKKRENSKIGKKSSNEKMK